MRRAFESRNIALWVSAAAMALVLSAGAATAQSGKPWRHGVIEPKADAGFFMMADQRKFFDKFGLKVEVVKIKNDQIGLKAALAGELDSYEGGPGGAIVADSRGVDVRIIGCPWLVVPHGIFVHDNIKSMQELKGKTIAI
jgi:NitT/TauT family transport system substrate-binding protein